MLRVSWLGHSTVVLDVGDVRILTDPLLRRHAGILRRRGPMPDSAGWRGANAVLLSHLHHDHAELASLRKLPGVPVLTASENAAWLRRRGIDSARGLGRGWSQLPASDVEVRLVHAEHRHRPMPHRPNAAHGHLLRHRDATVWVAGDTSLHDGLSDLGEFLGGEGLDLAVVPIAGWGPRLSKGHMDPEQAATACLVSGARWALPVHWGTLHLPFLDRFGGDWLDQPLSRFEEALGRVAPRCQAVRLRPGDSVVLHRREARHST